MATGFIFERNDGLVFNSLENKIYMPYKPNIQLPTRQIESIHILGLDSTLTYDYEAYDDRETTIPVFSMDWNNVKGFNRAFNGLGGKLYLNYKDGYYIVKKVTKVDRRDAKGIPEIDIDLQLAPYLYLPKEDISITTSNTIVANAGDIDSKCSIKVYANGNVTVYINENSYVITGLDGYITLNSETLQIFKDNTLCGNKVVGDLKKLKIKSGENTISWIGNIDKIELSYSPLLFE